MPDRLAFRPPTQPGVDNRVRLERNDRGEYLASIPWAEKRIRALAIYCSDGRWGQILDEFCYDGLGLPRYDRFAVPGGPAWLTVRHISLLVPNSAAKDQLKFLVEAHELERIVLVNHQGCAYYHEILKSSPEDLLAAQEQDLRDGAKTLREWFSGIKVDAYMALRDEEKAFFRPVEV
jgi:hypothetical protein